jgi:hypothetical protein
VAGVPAPALLLRGRRGSLLGGVAAIARACVELWVSSL